MLEDEDYTSDAFAKVTAQKKTPPSPAMTVKA
jgi:hypothetical protein